MSMQYPNSDYILILNQTRLIHLKMVLSRLVALKKLHWQTYFCFWYFRFPRNTSICYFHSLTCCWKTFNNCKFSIWEGFFLSTSMLLISLSSQPLFLGFSVTMFYSPFWHIHYRKFNLLNGLKSLIKYFTDIVVLLSTSICLSVGDLCCLNQLMTFLPGFPVSTFV